MYIFGTWRDNGLTHVCAFQDGKKCGGASPTLDDEDDGDEDGDGSEGGAMAVCMDGLLPASPASGASGSPAGPAGLKEDAAAAGNGLDAEGHAHAHATANGGSPLPAAQAAHDKELSELLAVESTAQACIMHALHIEQSGGVDGAGSPAPLVAPLTNGELSAQE
ncbi:hypothetical protein R5R35_013188 [Gryllus longicercus]|uniref:Uncharacterized protein n=1 Tax=Gryllus longicercus TaxID=2509291 RepID=A0AAN9V2P0_9ORTH